MTYLLTNKEITILLVLLYSSSSLFPTEHTNYGTLHPIKHEQMSINIQPSSVKEWKFACCPNRPLVHEPEIGNRGTTIMLIGAIPQLARCASESIISGCSKATSLCLCTNPNNYWVPYDCSSCEIVALDICSYTISSYVALGCCMVSCCAYIPCLTPHDRYGCALNCFKKIKERESILQNEDNQIHTH